MMFRKKHALLVVLTSVLVALSASFIYYICKIIPGSIGTGVDREGVYVLSGPHMQTGYLVVNNENGAVLYSNVFVLSQTIRVYNETFVWGGPRNVTADPMEANVELFEYDQQNQVLFLSFTCLYEVNVTITIIWGG